MNKIIFLDVDGVLNSNFWNDSHQREVSDGTLNDKDKVILLGGLLRIQVQKLCYTRDGDFGLTIILSH